ncbi:hypothetical protein WN55_07714 [Dufourea novaeangliae]|uniref:Uncharacterized protein n=1 Tax=Dufourea novaeangliae TaxID=178035 RepID=A0A154P636_DUFNO|nr:hypothetical protein WN55_07714 [Dufourea novaeangliae]
MKLHDTIKATRHSYVFGTRPKSPDFTDPSPKCQVSAPPQRSNVLEGKVKVKFNSNRSSP